MNDCIRYVSKLFQWGNDHIQRERPANSELEAVFNEINKRTAHMGADHNGVPTSLVGSAQFVVEWTKYLTHKIMQFHDNFVSYQVSFLVMATVLIVLGTLLSVKSIPTTALPPTREHHLFDPTDNEVNSECMIKDMNKNKRGRLECASASLHEDDWLRGDISTGHAFVAPIVITATLVGLYYLHHWGKLPHFARIFRWFVLGEGCFSVISVTANIWRSALRVVCHKYRCNPLRVASRYRVSLVDDNAEAHSINDGCVDVNPYYHDQSLGVRDDQDVSDKTGKLRRCGQCEAMKPTAIPMGQQLANVYFDWIQVGSLCFAGLTSWIYYWHPNNWIVSNILSMNVTIWTISRWNLKDLKVGMLLLCGLFLYDVYFVFGTNVMVTVANNLDLPVKLLLPTAGNGDSAGPGVSSGLNYALLGSGDVICPGLFISMCYKFDIWRWHSVHEDTEFHLLNLGRYVGRYSTVALVSYIVALCGCLVAADVWDVAQPAMLYVVPCLVGSVSLVAYASGDFREFWNFSYDTVIVDTTPGSDSCEPASSDLDILLDDGSAEGMRYDEDADADYISGDASSGSEDDEDVDADGDEDVDADGDDEVAQE
ncbi:aspartic endopeptidase KNAG_0E02600 [Huiozyma naganishii CBS 8797]|uniref:Uncharacterized protein n=1 Tax=Huiozyma naganishii (strain ATCC MYA-139 / BCRC 22969 / CBS 8797 / KCTC 17520 / NBRC 10181 / NCYC 3082 / Yp74L-3) TaxID=1071383 RepID=J7S6R3_HUIN7|nr:hypothetical protein KNAG_0E02600 [Kazachstania naganishii CBS 8797]CCK70519.1 hypothetical protein KNAG_0E02600 [Kazachstania naganishii CBS 8797]